MMFNWKTMFVGLLLVSLIVSGRLANHYRDNAISYKEQRDNKASELEKANATITDMQQRQLDADALDAKYTKELADEKAEMMLFGASLIMVVGCSSKANVLCHPQPKPPAPPAWAMMPPSNSLQLLDETFSVSGMESSATKQH